MQMMFRHFWNVIDSFRQEKVSSISASSSTIKSHASNKCDWIKYKLNESQSKSNEWMRAQKVNESLYRTCFFFFISLCIISTFFRVDQRVRAGKLKCARILWRGDAEITLNTSINEIWFGLKLSFLYFLVIFVALSSIVFSLRFVRTSKNFTSPKQPHLQYA